MSAETWSEPVTLTPGANLHDFLMTRAPLDATSSAPARGFRCRADGVQFKKKSNGKRYMTAATKILLVDDEADTLLPLLATRLEPRGYEISGLADPDRLHQILSVLKPNLVLLDLHFPGDDLLRHGSTTGGRLLGELRRAYPDLPVMLFTTSLEDLSQPVEGFREQPHARFAKPDFARHRAWAESLDREMGEAIRAAAFAREHAHEMLGFVVGKSPEMTEVARQVRLAAGNRLGVLIYGEAGTGKHATALAIHRLSGRHGPFVKLDCAAEDPATLEARLFGREGGADDPRGTPPLSGLLEQAHQGTLFLNQIQRLPLPVQDRLKAFMDTGRSIRMGAEAPGPPLGVRFIAATQHNLVALADDEYLLPELAYRIAVNLVALPPLRQRLGDLSELFDALLHRACTELGRELLPTLRPETLEKLRLHSWPGNIRELETTLLRAAAKTTSNVLLPEDIAFSPLGTSHRKGPRGPAERNPSVAAGNEVGTLEAGHQDPDQIRDAAARIMDRVWALPIEERYKIILETQGSLRVEVLTEFVRRLHAKLGRNVRHKDLFAELDPLAEAAQVPDEDWKRATDRVRQMINGSIGLTDLEFNR